MSTLPTFVKWKRTYKLTYEGSSRELGRWLCLQTICRWYLRSSFYSSDFSNIRALRQGRERRRGSDDGENTLVEQHTELVRNVISMV